MGSQQVVYGFIEVSPAWAEKDRELLQAWHFDELYPFPKIFNYNELGYESYMISFAGSFKSLEEDWLEWLTRFETLLKALHGRTATVRLEDEHDGHVQVVTYLNETGWSAEPQADSWQKWVRSSNQDDEVPAEMVAS